MKRDAQILLNYEQMKQKHGRDAMILFHIGDTYEAYYTDAQIIAKMLNLSLLFVTANATPAIRFPDTQLEEYRNRLLDAEYTVCVSEVRGSSGRHILKTL